MISFRMDYPPSVNHYWRRAPNGKGMYITADGKAYRSAAMEHRPESPIHGEVKLGLELTVPDKRRRDIDNVLKAILDAIGHAGIYEDDSQIVELHVRKVGVEAPGCVDVYLEAIG